MSLASTSSVTEWDHDTVQEGLLDELLEAVELGPDAVEQGGSGNGAIGIPSERTPSATRPVPSCCCGACASPSVSDLTNS